MAIIGVWQCSVVGANWIKLKNVGYFGWDLHDTLAMTHNKTWLFSYINKSKLLLSVEIIVKDKQTWFDRFARIEFITCFE